MEKQPLSNREELNIYDIELEFISINLIKKKYDNKNYEPLIFKEIILNNYDIVNYILKKYKSRSKEILKIYLNFKNNNDIDILEYALLFNYSLTKKINEENIKKNIKKRLINQKKKNEKILIDIIQNYYELFDDQNKLYKILYYGNTNIIKIILNIVDLNSVDINNNTILHYIVMFNNIELLEYYIKNNHNIIIDIKNNNNQNPLDIAVYNKNYEMINLLTSYLYVDLESGECPICLCEKKVIKLECHSNHIVCSCCYQLIEKCPLCRDFIKK